MANTENTRAATILTIAAAQGGAALDAEAREAAKAFLHSENENSTLFLKYSFSKADLDRREINLQIEEWLEIGDRYAKAFTTASYLGIVSNMGLGKIFANVPKGTSAGKPGASRAKVYEALKVSGKSGAEYIKLAENENLVMNTLDYAMDNNLPISQSRIIELLDIHKVVCANGLNVGYLQEIEELLALGKSVKYGGIGGAAENKGLSPSINPEG